MRELLTPTSALAGRGLDSSVAVIRTAVSTAQHGARLSVMSAPKAAAGGPLAYVREGDRIARTFRPAALICLFQMPRWPPHTAPKPVRGLSGILAAMCVR
jgi:dihydroxy-acid dehydratase